MKAGDKGAELVEAARKVVDSGADKENVGCFVGAVIEYLEEYTRRLIANMFSSSSNVPSITLTNLLDEVVQDFLEEKVDNPDYLIKLVRSENPEGYLYMTIKNLLVDRLDRQGLGPLPADNASHDDDDESYDPIENLQDPDILFLWTTRLVVFFHTGIDTFTAADTLVFVNKTGLLGYMGPDLSFFTAEKFKIAIGAYCDVCMMRRRRHLRGSDTACAIQGGKHLG